jgi:hypothetical protein
MYSCTPHKYHANDQIKNTEMGRACSTYGEEERRIQDFVEKREERSPGSPTHRWENNIKIDLTEVRWRNMD